MAKLTIELGPQYPRLYQPNGYISDNATDVIAEYEYCPDAFEYFQVLGLGKEVADIQLLQINADFACIMKARAISPFPVLEEYTRASTLSLLLYNTQYNNLFMDERCKSGRLEYSSQEYPQEHVIRRIMADSVDGLGIELSEAFSKCL